MRFTISILVILCGLTLWAQTDKGIVCGKVLDNDTKKPLQGVNVIYGVTKGVITNLEGEFCFLSDTGKYTLTFTYLGYIPVQETIRIIPDDTFTLSISLHVSIEELEEVVISASKSEEKISELTVSIATLSANYFTKRHTIHTDEIINQTPGVEILDGQASIRGGSGYSYGAGSRVLVLLDGLPVLSADASNAKWHFLPIESVEKIEIIKGASSVLYGSSALNGVINFRTRDATEEPVTKVTVLTGVFDKPCRDEWVWWDSPRIFSNASVFHAKKMGNTGITIGSFILHENGYRKDNDKKLARLNLKVNRQSKKSKALHYGINLNTMYTIKKDFILWQDADSGALIQNPNTALKLHGFALTADPYIIFARHNKLKHELQSRFQTMINTFPEAKQNNSNACDCFAEYRFWYNIHKKVNLTLGLMQTYTLVRSNMYDNHDGVNIAGYTQVNYYPVEKLKLITGIRLEQYILDGQKDKPEPIFRTGINYHLFKYTFIRASFGEGYRYPSVAEKHAFTTVGAVKIFPNPEIKPETGWSTEVGIKQGVSLLGWNGQADMAAFYSENINLIEYRFGYYPLPGTTENEPGFKASNVENSRVYGFETELMVRNTFGKIMTGFSGGYTYMVPVEFNPISSKSSEVYLKYRSKHTAKVMANARYKKFELGVNGIYKSEMLNIDDVFTNASTRETILPGFYAYWLANNNGYTIIDGQLTFLASENASLSFSVKNILNCEYMGRPGDVRPQRSYSLQYKVEF